MEIKTKFNIGDNIWVIKDFKAVKLEIKSIFLQVTSRNKRTPDPKKKGFVISKDIEIDKIFIKYLVEFPSGRETLQVEEDKAYATREELIHQLTKN